MFSIIKKLNLILNLSTDKYFYLLILGASIIGFFEVMGIISIFPFISLVTNQELIQTNKLINNFFVMSKLNEKEFLILFGVLLMIFLLFITLLNIIYNYLIYKYIYKKYHSLSSFSFKNYINQNFSFFLTKDNYYISKVLNLELMYIIDGVLISFLNLISKLIITILIIISLCIINFKVTFVVSIIFSLLYGLTALFSRRKIVEFGRKLESSNTNKLKIIQESFEGIREVKLFNQIDVQLKKFKKFVLDFCTSKSSYLIYSTIPRYVFEIIMFITTISFIIYLVQSSQKLESYLALIGIFAFAAVKVLPAFNSIFQAFTTIKFHVGTIDSVYNEIKVLKLNNQLKRSFERLNFNDNISLNNVDFNYPNSEISILKNINLKIKKNTLVGVGGDSGSGKTTLIDLILGILRPIKGNIIVDGHELNSENISSWLNNVAYVSQNFNFFNDSILFNVTFEENLIGDKKKKFFECLDLVNLKEFTDKKNEKENFVIGEDAKYLSGGQKQRLAIARAIYKNVELLVLDEPTSNLDINNTKKFMELINNLKKKLTIIIVSHDKSIINNCDKKYFMEDKKIVEN